MDIWTSRHVMLLWPKRELRDLNVSSSFANRIFTFPNVLFYNYTLCYVILCVCMYVRIANVSENRSEWSESGREQCPSKEKRTAVWKINTILTTARINSSPPQNQTSSADILSRSTPYHWNQTQTLIDIRRLTCLRIFTHDEPHSNGDFPIPEDFPPTLTSRCRLQNIGYLLIFRRQFKGKGQINEIW